MPFLTFLTTGSDNSTVLVPPDNRGAKPGHILLLRLKLISVAVVFMAILYHGILQEEEDRSCDPLITSGRFITKDTWQPYGCTMHNYTSKETKQCLRTAAAHTNTTTKIVLVGDSRMRYLTARILEHLGVPEDVRRGVKYLKQPTFLFTMKELRFQLEYYKVKRLEKTAAKTVVNELKKNPPSLVVTGAVLHFIVDYKEQSRAKGVPAYKAGIKMFEKEVKNLPPSTIILYRLTEPFSKENKKTYRTNGDIDFYNSAALEVFNRSTVQLWHSSYSIARERYWDYPDGAHASNITMMYDIQIMLNLLCNRHMPTLPEDTCCMMKPAKAKSIQALSTVIIMVTVCVIVCVWMLLKQVNRWRRTRAKDVCVDNLEDQLPLVATNTEVLHKEQPLEGSAHHVINKTKDQIIQQKDSALQIVWPLLKLIFILSYFLLCDKFDFFDKVSKEFSPIRFVVPLLVVACGAAYSITTKRTGEEQILSRDITDEWKGWMQFVLLVYHASGASTNLPIYMHARVIVSSYVSLNGYGHFSRFWKTGSAGGFTRYCQVMYRMNFLTILLCLVMDQPYMNYYFVVLVSFWYTVLHIVLAMPPHLAQSGLEKTPMDFVRAAFKIVLVALIIIVLQNFKVFDSLFSPWQLSELFQLKGHPGVEEWRFRWMLDRFSVLYGMIFALVCQAWTRFWPSNSIVSGWPTSKSGVALLAALSMSCFVCYPLLLQTCDTKQECNRFHPYFTWIPILGYVFFRHHSMIFRTHFSTLFAFLGQISLELFICQYHILLASNTHSLLVLIPGPLAINAIVTGVVFLCSAHEISIITSELQPTLVPSDIKKMIWNIVVGGVFILIIGYMSMIQ